VLPQLVGLLVAADRAVVHLAIELLNSLAHQSELMQLLVTSGTLNTLSVAYQVRLSDYTHAFSFLQLSTDSLLLRDPLLN
jgi:hypothetical protein